MAAETEHRILVERLPQDCPDEDLDRLAEIEAACFSHPMNVMQIQSLLRSGPTRFYAARECADGPIVGSLWAQTVLDEGYIGNVAVHPDNRRRGVGDAMLDALEHSARETQLRFLTLEVRASNSPAIGLYEKHGYDRVGLRKGYYSDPKEDAVLMTKDF